MKQALVSLFRAVVGARTEAVAQQAVLPELTAAELRLVSGGDGASSAPRGTW